MMKVEFEYGEYYIVADVDVDYVRIVSGLPSDIDPEIEGKIADEAYREAVEQGMETYKDEYDMYGLSRGDF